MSDCFLNILNLKKKSNSSLFCYYILLFFLFLGNATHAQLFVSDSSQLFISEGALFVVKNGEEEVVLSSQPEKVKMTISQGTTFIHSQEFQNVEIVYVDSIVNSKPLLATRITQEKKTISKKEYAKEEAKEQKIKPVHIFKTAPSKNAIGAENAMKWVSITTTTDLFISKLILYPFTKRDLISRKCIFINQDVKINPHWFLNNIWARPPPMYSLT